MYIIFNKCYSFLILVNEMWNLFVYLFIYRERRRKGEREKQDIDVWGNHQSVASCTPPTGDVVHNPGMCPDRESNWQPFGAQASAQSRATPARAYNHNF